MAVIQIACVQDFREIRIDFQVDMNAVDTIGQVGIIGENEPLNWDTPTFLSDEDGDGIYSKTITIKAAYNYAAFKFTNDSQIELNGKGNRSVIFREKTSTSYNGVYDELSEAEKYRNY